MGTMTDSTSESSDETSEISATLSSRSDVARSIWQRWRPGQYSAVCIVTGAATALLFPQQHSELVGGIVTDPCRDFLGMFFFCGLILVSLAAGCAAACLGKRAAASGHARSACGYAVVNWLQAILSSVSLHTVNTDCMYGIVQEHQYAPLVLSRLALYVTGSFWIQLLIASRLELLEKSSHRKFRSGCMRKLICVQQAACATVIAISAFCCLAAGMSWTSDGVLHIIIWGASLTMSCNVAASFVAICSLIQCFLEMRRVLHAAELKDTPVAALSALRQARRFAALQVMGVSFRIVFTILVVPAAILGYRDIQLQVELVWIIFFVQALYFLGNAAAVLFLSGSHRLQKVEIKGHGGHCAWLCPEQPKASAAGSPQGAEPSKDEWSPSWLAKVEELSLRGMTLRSLLHFYQDQLPYVDWQYVPSMHKTRDVVRRAIIPLTSEEECAYAVSSLNKDGPQRAGVMVTHNWGNSFKDLLAAVISDALKECSFNLAAKLLEKDSVLLYEMLAQSGRLDDTYWLCAFAVNQHITICHTNHYDRDPLTDELHPVCSCSSTNVRDLDGRNALSEINKFDDMMYHLAATGGCRQVIAVDQSLDLFNRAWCVAEIAEASRLQMKQSLKLASKETILQCACSLENLDVRCMRASCETDKARILNKINSSTNIDQFNTELQSLIFDPKSGLLASWHAMDSLQQMGEVGRLIRWGLADAGTGKVWKAWEAQC